MRGRVQQWVDRIRGQISFYQYYATVHPETCEICLGHHGEIYPGREGHPQPPLHPGCRCTLLEFPSRELEYYQQHGMRMKQRAQLERERRQLFQRGCEALSRSAAEALTLFAQSVQIEIYISDIEALCREQREALRASASVSRKLRDLFLKAYRHKFEGEKYQSMPEGMKSKQRVHGLSVIQELFKEYAEDSRGA